MPRKSAFVIVAFTWDRIPGSSEKFLINLIYFNNYIKLEKALLITGSIQL